MVAFNLLIQGVTERCRLSWLPNSALVYEPKCGGKGVAGSRPMSTAVHMETAQINFWRFNSILNLCSNPSNYQCVGNELALNKRKSKSKPSSYLLALFCDYKIHASSPLKSFTFAW